MAWLGCRSVRAQTSGFVFRELLSVGCVYLLDPAVPAL